MKVAKNIDPDVDRGPAVHLHRDAGHPRPRRAVRGRDQGRRSRPGRQGARSQEAHGAGQLDQGADRRPEARRAAAGDSSAASWPRSSTSTSATTSPLVIADVGGMWKSDSGVPRTSKFRVAGHLLQRLRRIRPPPDVRDPQAGAAPGRSRRPGDGRRAQDRATSTGPARSPTKLSKKLGEPPFVIQDWYELNHSLFHALSIQKLGPGHHPDPDHHGRDVQHGVGADHAGHRQDPGDRNPEIDGLDVSSSMARAFVVVGMIIGGIGTTIGVGIGLVTCKVVSGLRLPPRSARLPHRHACRSTSGPTRSPWSRW